MAERIELIVMMEAPSQTVWRPGRRLPREAGDPLGFTAFHLTLQNVEGTDHELTGPFSRTTDESLKGENL